MEQRIVLRLIKGAHPVCGWRAPSSSVFRGVYTIPPQVFLPSGDRSKDLGKRSIVAWASRGWDASVLGCKSRLFYGHWAYGQIQWRPRRSYCQCRICCWIYGNLAEILKELLTVSKSCCHRPILKVPYQLTIEKLFSLLSMFSYQGSQNQGGRGQARRGQQIFKKPWTTRFSDFPMALNSEIVLNTMIPYE